MISLIKLKLNKIFKNEFQEFEDNKSETQQHLEDILIKFTKEYKHDLAFAYDMQDMYGTVEVFRKYKPLVAEFYNNILNSNIDEELYVEYLSIKNGLPMYIIRDLLTESQELLNLSES